MSATEVTPSSEEMSTPKRYSVRLGTIDFGRNFETKMAALLSLRCAGDPNTQDMWMATNVKNCADFDDIVMYRQTTNNERVTYFIQLKYQQNPRLIKPQEFKQEGRSFYLKKYFKGLSEIRESENDAEETLEFKIFDSIKQNLEQTVFVLFTNRKTSDKCSFLEDVTDEGNDHLYYLSTKHGSIHKFKYERFNFDLEEHENNFAEKLYFLQNQTMNTLNEKESVDVEILNQIKETIQPFHLPDEELNVIAKKFVSFIHERSKGELGHHFSLTKAVVMQKFVHLLLKPYVVKIEEPKSMFYNHSLWRNIIKDKKVTIVDGDDIVDEFLQSYIHGCFVDHQNNVKKQTVDDVILLEPDYNKIYKALWKRGKVPLLLESSGEKSFEFIKHALMLQGLTNIWAIIINRSKSKVNVKIESSFSTLQDLGQKYIKKILCHPVKLQGRSSVKLANLLDHQNYELVTVKDVIHILSGIFNIGNKFKPLPRVFIKRSLILSNKIFQNLSDQRFVIRYRSAESREIFLEQYGFSYGSEVCSCQAGQECSHPIVLVQSQNDVEVCPKNNSVVHYLSWHDTGSLEWIKCFTNNPVRRSAFPALISASSGTGKSVYLDYIAQTAWTSMWVLKINLLDYTDIYKNETVENFLSRCNSEILKGSKSYNTLALTVFDEYLKNKNVLVLLDGFDDIVPKYKLEVVKIIKHLQNSGYFVCVTTRPIMRDFLEKELNTFAVALNLFNKGDQIHFLLKYFATQNDHVVLNSLKKKKVLHFFVRKFLDMAEENFNSQCDLHNHLLAFSDVCREFLKSRCFDVNEHFDLLHLYKNFVMANRNKIFD